MFDYIVVDTPAQFSEHVLTAMDVSSQLVLLTTPDVPALKNLRVTLDMLDLLSYPRQIRSVVRQPLGLQGRAEPRACGTGRAVPDLRAHPVQPRRAHLDQQGHAHHPGNPGHPVSQAVSRLVQQRLLGQPADAAGGRPARSRRRRRVGMSLSDRLPSMRVAGAPRARAAR